MGNTNKEVFSKYAGSIYNLHIASRMVQKGIFKVCRQYTKLIASGMVQKGLLLINICG